MGLCRLSTSPSIGFSTMLIDEVVTGARRLVSELGTGDDYANVLRIPFKVSHQEAPGKIAEFAGTCVCDLDIQDNRAYINVRCLLPPSVRGLRVQALLAVGRKISTAVRKASHNEYSVGKVPRRNDMWYIYQRGTK